jgi:hypothetical protein
MWGGRVLYRPKCFPNHPAYGVYAMESIVTKEYIVYQPGQSDISVFDINELRHIFDHNRSEYESLPEDNPRRNILAGENEKIIHRIFELYEA